MGEIAEMMLDGTMDPETGEWNFDGEDGPGFPMTAEEAADYRVFMANLDRAWRPPGRPDPISTPRGTRSGGWPMPKGKGLSKNARRRRNRKLRAERPNPESTTR